MKTKLLFLLVLSLFINFFTSKTKAQVLVSDSLALVDLYNSTNGPHWTHADNWLRRNSPVSQWEGVFLQGNRVSQLYLGGQGLNGSLPASLFTLDSLITLQLSGNSIMSTLSADISKLTILHYLAVDNNQFTGTLPVTIGKLSQLNTFLANNNSFTGTFPASIGNCRQLFSLDLSNNKLTGTLPRSIGSLINIYYIVLNNNSFSGSIPNVFDSLLQLGYLNLNNNHFTGEMPASLRFCKVLYFLEVSNNELTLSKNIPVASDAYVSEVTLDNNRFTFNGLEYVAAKLSSYSTYSPQAPIPVHPYAKGLAVSAGGTLANNTYTWKKAGNPAGTTVIQGDSVFYPTENGNYSVSVTNRIATGLTLQSNTVACTTCGSPALSLSVYPNPAVSTLTLNGLSSTTNVKITISDLSGTMWFSTMSNHQVSVKSNISQLKPGSYRVQVTNGNDRQTIQFVKQ